MEQNLKLSDNQGELLNDPSSYRRLIGRLIYITITILDIMYYGNILSQFMHALRKPHWDFALRIVRCLKNSPGTGLLFSVNGSLQLSLLRRKLGKLSYD